MDEIGIAARALSINKVSGSATFIALKDSVEELSGLAPKDHDVLIQAFDISVHKVKFIEPHTFRFSGTDQNGNRTFVVAHFSQLVARVVFLPKSGVERVVTGFARQEA